MSQRCTDYLIRAGLLALLLAALMADGLFYGVPVVQRYGAMVWER